MGIFVRGSSGHSRPHCSYARQDHEGAGLRGAIRQTGRFSRCRRGHENGALDILELIFQSISVRMKDAMRVRKTKKILQYTAIFEEAPEGGYIVRIPVLGCTTEGETFEEAKVMAQDVIRCYLASLIKHGEPIPEEGSTEIISTLKVPVFVPAL